MPHRFALTVHYEDTDLSGFVYHANYLKFIERARSDWVRGLGLDQNALRAAGLVFAVHRLEADFLAPARLDDRLEVRTAPAGWTPARLVLDQEVRRGAGPQDATGADATGSDAEAPGPAVLFRARVTLVAMTPAGRPRRLPALLASQLPAASVTGGTAGPAGAADGPPGPPPGRA